MIFLDLASGRYFCLSPADERAFRAVTGGAADRALDEDVARLVRLDLLDGAGRDIRAVPMARETPVTEWTDPGGEPRPAARLLAQAGAALFRAAIDVRFGSLGRILKAIETRKAAVVGHGGSPRSIIDVVRAFAFWSAWVSPRDRCLPRSIAMARLLLDQGVAADLVIGVVSRPFRAHCWVEHDATLLNDSVEHVGNYTPILVV